MTKTSETPQKKRVLVVDDSPDILDSLMIALRDEFNVDIAIDGKRALEEIAKTKPDIILLDTEMPGWDGYWALQQLKSMEEYSGIPVVMVSGNGKDPREREKAIERGAVDYILKPYTLDQLVATVRRVLENPQYRH